jgi:hypothetical protein
VNNLPAHDHRRQARGSVGQSDREHPRYAHEAVITLWASGAAHQGRTTNVSRGGLCADLDVALPVGSEVELDLQLVFDDDAQSEPLRLPARVVWCTPLDEGHQLGFAFRPLTRDAAEYLTMFLRYLDDRSRPTRVPRAERSIDDRFG